MNRRSFFRGLAAGVLGAAATIYAPRVLVKDLTFMGTPIYATLVFSTDRGPNGFYPIWQSEVDGLAAEHRREIQKEMFALGTGQAYEPPEWRKLDYYWDEA